LKIPVHFNLETEPDDYELAPLGVKYNITGIRKIYQHFSNLRPHLQEITQAPVHYNLMWRIDPHFEATCGSIAELIPQHADIIQAICDNGDELGVHFHPLCWNKQKEQWEFCCEPEWVEQNFIKGYEELSRAVGFRPSVVRLSDNILATERTMTMLERLGIKIDITVEPGVPDTHEVWAGVARGNSFDKMPRYPYQPAPGNLLEPGTTAKRNLWLVPTSTGYTNHVRYGTTVSFEKETLALDLAFYPPSFQEVMQKRLESMETPYLVIVANSYTINNPQFQAYFEENLKFILSHPLISQFQFTNSSELVSAYAVKPVVPSYSPYTVWLKQQLTRQRLAFEELERNYQGLEAYTQKLVSNLEQQQTEASKLAEYVIKLENQLAQQQTAYKDLEQYTDKLLEALKEHKQYINEVEESYRALERA
jgi:hypothetical protein